MNNEFKGDIEIILDNENISKEIEKNNAKAEALLKDKKKMERFLERLERKLSLIPVAGKYLSDVPVLISLVKAYVDKEYIDIPIGTIIAIVGALIYVLSPIDLIPDGIPVIGYIDDAAVLAFAYKLVHDDVTEYKEWKEAKNNIINNG